MTSLWPGSRGPAQQLIALALLLVSTGRLHAAGPAATPGDEPAVAAPAPSSSPQLSDAERQEQFRVHQERATQLFAQGAWQSAIVEYRAAYDLAQRPLLLFNIAQSYRKDARSEEALAFYERFLREAQQSPLVPEAEAHAAAMRAQMQIERLSRERQAAELQAAERTAAAARLEQQRLDAHLREQAKAPPPPVPLHKQRWFWPVVVGAGAVVIGLTVGLAVGLRPTYPNSDLGVFSVQFL